MVRVNNGPPASCYCISLFPLHGEEYGFGIPPFDVFRWSIHTIDAASKVGVNSCREMPNEGIVVGDATECYIVLELGDVFVEGQVFGYLSGAEPSDSLVF